MSPMLLFRFEQCTLNFGGKTTLEAERAPSICTQYTTVSSSILTGNLRSTSDRKRAQVSLQAAYVCRPYQQANPNRSQVKAQQHWISYLFVDVTCNKPFGQAKRVCFLPKTPQSLVGDDEEIRPDQQP